MGKSKKGGPRRLGRPRHRVVVVDGCEIGQYRGAMTLRVGAEHRRPELLAIPAAAGDLVGKLAAASLDAEEQYWDVIRSVLGDVEPGNRAVSMARMEAWLLEQDWVGVLGGVPGPPDPLFLVSHVGHVGLAAAPPFSVRPVLAVFDPLQLRRIAPGLRSAITAAHAEARMTSARHSTQAALDFLSRQPWPRQAAEPTHEEAVEHMRRRYEQFLSRSPYQRPPQNDLPLS